MVFGQYPPLSKELAHPVWNRVFTWIAQNAETLSDGEYELSGRDMFASIVTVPTVSASDAIFEMHQKYIDVHYCISGGEIIGHSPAGQLKEKTLFDIEKDYQLFYPIESYKTVQMTPGSFAIFYPGELHMPKIQDGTHTEVKKVVIKINVTLL